MTKTSLLFTFLLFSLFNLHAQDQYTVGAATRSIEPGEKTYSLSLSGFAAPKEGRFSLQWKKNDSPGKLLQEQLRNQDTRFKNQQIVSFAQHKNALYSVDQQGALYRAGSKSAHPKQHKIDTETRGRLISVTSDGAHLYALNSNDSIWKIDLSDQHNPWQLIGINNKITYTIHLEKIASVQNRLYGIAADGAVYEAVHTTDNSLSVTSMAIGYKGKKILIIGVDLTGFPTVYIENLKKIISKKHRIPVNAILVNASHTHFAPVTAGWSTWESFYQYPDSTYLNGVLKTAILASADKALSSMQPSSLSYNTGTTAIGINRRNNATVKHPYDNSVSVLEAINLRTREKNILFMTACHPVFTSGKGAPYMLSANYPGVCRDVLTQDQGYKNAVFIQGCGGDINPVNLDFRETGKALAEDVGRVVSGGMQPVSKAPISFFMDEVKVPVKPWSRDSIIKFKAANEKRAGAVEIDKNIRWANLMLQSKQPPATTLTELVQTINFGNIKLVGLSREVVNEYGTAIKQLWPEKQVMVAGYCNDVSSYLPNHWHIEQGHYEGYDSFFWYAQPALPPVNILNIIVDQIKKNNR